MRAAEIQIRRAELADAAAVAAVLLDSFVEFKALYTEGGFAATTPNVEEIRARMREGPVWLASCDSVPLGTVSAVANRESLYIRGMAVLPPLADREPARDCCDKSKTGLRAKDTLVYPSAQRRSWIQPFVCTRNLVSAERTMVFTIYSAHLCSP
jgi:hypothetical protein